MGKGKHRVASWLIAAVVVGSASGCLSTPMDARYVYQDGEYGVIGVPRNSSYGKKDYRQQARELMTLHFPEGYEIVRAEEIVAGERVTDTARKVEVETEPGLNALNQMLKVGKLAKSSSLDQKDTLQITESRIIYRRKGARNPASADGFAEVATAVPNLYIDPNDTVRKLGATTLLAAQKKAEDPAKGDAAKVTVAAKATIDSGVQKASAEVAK